MASYIDNLLIFREISHIQQLKKAVTAKIKITDLGPISYYLGIK